MFRYTLLSRRQPSSPGEPAPPVRVCVLPPLKPQNNANPNLMTKRLSLLQLPVPSTVTSSRWPRSAEEAELPCVPPRKLGSQFIQKKLAIRPTRTSAIPNLGVVVPHIGLRHPIYSLSTSPYRPRLGQISCICMRHHLSIHDEQPCVLWARRHQSYRTRQIVFDPTLGVGMSLPSRRRMFQPKDAIICRNSRACPS